MVVEAEAEVKVAVAEEVEVETQPETGQIKTKIKRDKGTTIANEVTTRRWRGEGSLGERCKVYLKHISSSKSCKT